MIDKAHDNNFNFLRLVGACCVIFSHSYDVVGRSNEEPIGNISNGTLEASAIGLAIFFFVSGYFVTKSALTSTSILNFVKKRVLRIYPALIVCTLISVFIAAPLLSSLPVRDYFTNIATGKYLLNITGLIIRMELPGVFQSSAYHVHAFNASLWSISIEITLYISILILSIFSFGNRKKIFTIAASIILISLFSILFFYSSIDFTIKRNINLTCVFFLGSLAFTASLNKKAILYALITTITAGLLFSITSLKSNAECLLLIILSCLVYLAGMSKRVKIRLSTDISYGLYIFAFPIQQWLFSTVHFNNNPLLNFSLALIVTGFVGYLSWRFIEQPFMQFKYKNSN